MKDLVDRTYSKNCKRQNSVGTKSKLFLKSSWERTWDHSVSAIKKKIEAQIVSIKAKVITAQFSGSRRVGFRSLQLFSSWRIAVCEINRTKLNTIHIE